MLTAGGRGLGDFGQILPVIDRMVAEERPLSDTALLAAILLPKIMLRRMDIEAVKGPLTRPAIEVMIQEEVAPFLQRLARSNLRSPPVVHAPTRFPPLSQPR